MSVIVILPQTMPLESTLSPRIGTGGNVRGVPVQLCGGTLTLRLFYTIMVHP